MQVHHTHYPPVLGTEDPWKDLITLCDKCHRKIEDEKREERKKAEERERQMMERIAESRRRIEEEREEYRYAEKVTKEFIEQVKFADLSACFTHGVDYCNREVVKAELSAYFKKRDAKFISTMISKVQDYFRNRRYEVILKMIEDGVTRKDIQKITGFSYNMVKKVIEKPYVAKSILKNEKENDENV